MLRRIIKIDQDKCNGCELCTKACHENAIVMRDKKAVLLRDDYCDGLGDCLPVCPTGAITFEERDTLAYDDEAVKENQKKIKEQQNISSQGCPGSMAKKIEHTDASSMLNQWPVQIKLLNPNASFLKDAHLLIAADCTAYAYGNFHNDFMKDKTVLIGCPKLDMIDYCDHLTQILMNNEVKSITVVRMEVPCCQGIVSAVEDALKKSGKIIPWGYKIISTEGKIKEQSN